MSTARIQITRPRLSVAMIVRNEEPVLAETLSSVQSIADEMVIDDTGSQDATCRIAERFGAQLGHTPWAEDFSAARNACYRRAGGDWVLWLDAGETLSHADAAALRKFIDQETSSPKAYLLRVEIPPPQGEVSGEQIVQLRLLPGAAGLRFEGRVRESVAASVREKDWAIDSAPGRILRHPRQHDPERRRRRAERNLALAEREKTEHRQPVPRLLLAEGEAYELLGEYAKAQSAFLQVLTAAPHGSTEMLQGYYGLLACCNQLPGPGLQRIQICLKALEVFPYDAQLLLTMGGYLQGENRLDLAVRAFQTAVETGRVDLETWHLSELAEVAVACYGAALQLQGNSAKAGRILEDSLRRYPRSARLKRLSLEVFIQLGRRDKALEIAETLFSDWPDRALLADVIRGACLARKRQWTAALGSLQSAYLRGCRHPICLRWLAVTLVSQGQAEAALPVLKEWRQAEPQHPELQAYLAAFAEKTDSGTEEEKTPSVKGSGSSPDRQYRLDLAGIFSSPFPPQGSLPHTLPLPGNSLPLRP